MQDHLLENNVLQGILPHSLDSPNGACLLHEQSFLAPSPGGAPRLFEHQGSSFDRGCCAPILHCSMLRSLDVLKEVEEMVDGF